MAQVYGYKEQDNDFQVFPSGADWKKQITVNGIKRYLNDHLRIQLDEVRVAIDAFKEASTPTREMGFWALGRMVLAPVSFLGSLYKGRNHTNTAIDFLEEYIGRRQNLHAYLDLSALIFHMYRHGLMHAAMPKIIERDDGVLVGWKVTPNPADHLTKYMGAKGVTVVFNAEQFYLDLVKAIDIYTADFDGPRQAQLVTDFKRGFLLMATIQRRTEAFWRVA